jgi:hypothetical protein
MPKNFIKVISVLFALIMAGVGLEHFNQGNYKWAIIHILLAIYFGILKPLDKNA